MKTPYVRLVCRCCGYVVAQAMTIHIPPIVQHIVMVAVAITIGYWLLLELGRGGPK